VAPNQRNKARSGSARGVTVVGQGPLDLLQNTILGGTATFTNPVAIFLNPESHVRRLENNMIGVSSVQNTANGAYPIFAIGCEDDRFGSFQGNAFLTPFSGGTTSELLMERYPCDAGNPNIVITSFAQVKQINPDVDVSNNVRVAKNCNGAPEGECIPFDPCGDASKCQEAILGHDLGPQDLAQGLPTLPDKLPCSLVKRGAILQEAPLDAAGTMRPKLVTPGAIEQDSCQ
jgi:hypothetical protein